MLREFLSEHRDRLIERCRVGAGQRAARRANEETLDHGIALLIDQIIKTLEMEQSSDPLHNRKGSGAAAGCDSVTLEIGATARVHAHELLQCGYTLDRVVHHYGDFCQAVADLASEYNMVIPAKEFRTLNHCLDTAIADSVTEYAYEHELLVVDRGADAFHERLGIFAHELRNLIATATHAVAAMKTGQVGLTGPTGAMLDRSLIRLRGLIDRSLADVRLGAPVPGRAQLIGLADFVAEVRSAAALEAQSRDCVLVVSPVHPRLAVDADPEMLFSAVNNLLQNAFKFTRHQTVVSLNAYATTDRILIDVRDHCGGLPPGDPERLFHPFAQGGEDTSGVGLGLSICRRSIEANNGTLSARDIPGTGCVFTIDLPQHLLSERFFRI